MREIKYTSQFQKDYRKLKRQNNFRLINSIFLKVVASLQMDLPLENKYKDHYLRGNFQGLKECHLKPDLLLIYSKPNDHELILIRLGSHAELF